MDDNRVILSGFSISFSDICDKILYYDDPIAENVGYNTIFGEYKYALLNFNDSIRTNGFKRILLNIINKKAFNECCKYDSFFRYSSLLNEIASKKHDDVISSELVKAMAVSSEEDKHAETSFYKLDIINI